MPLGTFYADASYLNDYVSYVTVPTTGGGAASFALPAAGDGSQVLKYRTVTITDVTVAKGGTVNAAISAYVRVDGHAIEANGGPYSTGDGSYARILKPGGSITINRGTITGLTFLNGGANAQTLQIELGG